MTITHDRVLQIPVTFETKITQFPNGFLLTVLFQEFFLIPTLFSFIFAGLKFRENFLATFRESLISRSRRKIVFAGNLISRN